MMLIKNSATSKFFMPVKANGFNPLTPNAFKNIDMPLMIAVDSMKSMPLFMGETPLCAIAVLSVLLYFTPNMHWLLRNSKKEKDVCVLHLVR